MKIFKKLTQSVIPCFLFCHPVLDRTCQETTGSRNKIFNWIPAFAGMTEGWLGMTVVAGMTEGWLGMTGK